METPVPPRENVKREHARVERSKNRRVAIGGGGGTFLLLLRFSHSTIYILEGKESGMGENVGIRFMGPVCLATIVN